MKAFLSLITVLFISTSLNAQNITGKWYGILEVPGNSLRIHIEIKKEQNNYSCVLASPDQSTNEFSATSINFINPNLNIELSNLNIAYKGVLKKNEIVGTFTQSGRSLPLIFKRSESKKEKPTTLDGKIDKIFAGWNRKKSPGGAVGIMKDGAIIYAKAFGLASLEYNVSNTPETLFNIGSVSKQFTAMGIVLLQEQGKLSFDDDIRKYLPDVPDFGYKITIRHLLHHTSGLRSLHALFTIAGWRDDDSKTNADLRRIMRYQQDLNFKPGEEFLYSNTGYMFMADIIESITKEKFATWMKKSIFKPLGLKNTYVEDKYNRVVPNNATSYSYGSGAFEREVEYWGYVGSGNVHSTLHDLLIWLSNFKTPKKGWQTAFEALQTLDPLNNGKPNNQAFGIFIDEFNGKRRIQHGGAVGGFRAFVSTFPDEALSIVVLSNFSSSSVGRKANEVAELFLKDVNEKKQYISKLPKAISYKPKDLKVFEGLFWNDKENYSRKLYIKNDTLMYQRSPANESKLVPISKNKFKMLDVDVDLVVDFKVKKNNVDAMEILINDETPIIMKAYKAFSPSIEEKKEYTGTYYSPELETEYIFYLENDELKWRHIRHGEFPLQFISRNILRIHPRAVIKIKRNTKGTIEGFYVTNGRVRNLWFKKRS